jgi:hypothetical protein
MAKQYQVGWKPSDCIRKNVSRLEKVQLGYKGEELVAKLVNGQTTTHTAVFDVVIPTDGVIEVKAQHYAAKKYECRMERDALATKIKQAKKQKREIWTYMTIIDDSTEANIIAVYKREGVGNFNVKTMDFVGSYDRWGNELGIKFDQYGKRV